MKRDRIERRCPPAVRPIILLVAEALIATAAIAQDPARFPPPKSGPPIIEPRARELMELVERRMSGLRSFTAEFRRTGKNPGGVSKVAPSRMTVAILKPYLYRIDRRAEGENPTTCIADSIRVIYLDKSYGFQGTDPSCIDNVLPPNLTLASRTVRRLLWPGEWHHGRLEEGGLISLKMARPDTIDGRPLQVVEWIYRDSYQAEEDDELRVSMISIDSTGLIWRVHNAEPKQGYERDNLMVSFSEDGKLTPADFVIKGVTDTFPPLPKYPHPEKSGKIDLAKVDFSVPMAGGGTFTLSKALASRSLLAIYTWAYW